jgi:NAD(P)H-flavin reductase
VVGHERRTFDIAVITIQPVEPYEYRPGQSMALEAASRPRLWRYYSPANAPREDGSIDLHVRRVPGGQVSSALVDRTQKGDFVRLGAPVGHRLTLPDADLASVSTAASDLLMIAGGTGLAPLRAVAEQVAAETVLGGPARRVHIFAGTRRARELYDLDGLLALAAEHPWLTVTPVISVPGGRPPTRADAGAGAAALVRPEVGDVGEVALAHADGGLDREVYVCGSNGMVAATLQLLRNAGCPPERLHHEGFQGLGGDIYGHL